MTVISQIIYLHGKTSCLLKHLNKEKQIIFSLLLHYLASKRPWNLPLWYVCKMTTASHYYPCVREGVCSSFRSVWGAHDQELDVGRVDLTDNQAFAECQWIWVLFNITKVALFGFSWLIFTSWGYFKLKLNKGKIISKKLLMLQPYFMLMLWKFSYCLPIWNDTSFICAD